MDKSKLLKLARMVMNLSEIKTNKGELISETVIEVGSEVFIEDANDMLVAAPDGEYVTQDEVTIVVADGKVVEIREKEQKEQPVEDPKPEQMDEATEAALAEKDARIAELEAALEAKDQELADKDARIGELETELEDLKAKLAESDARSAEEELKMSKQNKTNTIIFNQFKK